jgi:exosortase/archaeosortase family protein
MSADILAGDGAARSAAPSPFHGARAVARWLAAGLSCVSAVTLIADEAGYRGFEAQLAAAGVRDLLGYSAVALTDRQTFVFAYGSGDARHMLGLTVSLGCSSVFLLAPILMLTGILAAYSSKPLLRLGVAAAAAAAVFLAANLLRLVMIAALMDWWGIQAGFGWGHTLFGSILTLLGMAAASAVYYLLVRQQDRLRPSRDRRSRA